MDAQIGMKWEVLERVVAILLAFADLAERAAGAPHPVRCVVLWILQRAEAVAQEFVAGSTVAVRWTTSAEATPVRHGFDAADAIHLALSFRMLALVLGALVTQLRRQAFLHRSRRSYRQRPRFHRMSDVLEAAVARAQRPDTS